jgi:hypothetical protein
MTKLGLNISRSSQEMRGEEIACMRGVSGFRVVGFEGVGLTASFGVSKSSLKLHVNI